MFKFNISIMKNLVILTLLEIIILLVMTGCDGNSSTNSLVTVDVTKSSYSPKKELVLQDFMDVEYIPLETKENFINQGVVEAIGEKYIIVKNYGRDGDIFVYDRSGKAIRKINHKGQGGEEYLFCSGITLDEENNEILVDDHIIKKVLVYDLEGNFKRSFKQKQTGGSQCYWNIYNYDKDNLICYDELNKDTPFLIVSKMDGSITKEIKVPFKEKKLLFQILQHEKGTKVVGPGEYSRIIPFNGNWILLELSSDTIYTLMSDYSLRPFIAKTPPIHTMNPEFHLILRLVTNRYYFMESIKNVFDFKKKEGFPKTHILYDTQENEFSSYIVYNRDYSSKKELNMFMLSPINSTGELCATLNAPDLCQDYKDGILKGKLKEIAAKLSEDDNGVIMLVKPKN